MNINTDFIISSIIRFILYPELPGWFLLIKIIFLLVSLFFMGIIVFALIKTLWLKRIILWDMKEYLTYRHYGLPKTEKKWGKIKERLEIGTESEAKLAIIEADSFLNDILKVMGYVGETLGEKLNKLTTDVLMNLEEIKGVHEIHSNIIHDPSYRLDIEEAKRVLDVYEKTLIELQAL